MATVLQYRADFKHALIGDFTKYAEYARANGATFSFTNMNRSIEMRGNHRTISRLEDMMQNDGLQFSGGFSYVQE